MNCLTIERQNYKIVTDWSNKVVLPYQDQSIILKLASVSDFLEPSVLNFQLKRNIKYWFYESSS